MIGLFLVIVLLAVFVYGYWMMKRVDRFIQHLNHQQITDFWH